MAKKKGGFGRFIGNLTGQPYDRLLNRVDKIAKEFSGEELARECDRLAKTVERQLDPEEQIDEEEHDLIMERIEEIHPDGKTYPRRGDDEDEFYDSDDIPDAPELNLDTRMGLDELMQPRGDEFTGSFGRDEYKEYQQQLASEFYAESEEAIAAGDYDEMTSQDPGNRVFHDVEDEAKDLKRQIAQEMGIAEEEPESDDDDTYRVDEDGTEWWQDDQSKWWYRPKGEEDWYPYDD